ncbi:ATP-binding protein [Hazenella sp. IB182357]|uniref:ATP-binding protein n=1 Tax=Polycladospora coralii TaxID=2771432 RepID=A0A926RV45_9BACL|nr:ATP-binding protein [Polycladospora coralii]MBD1373768.1 ATP-binding protein [Polycladospora coralii]
MDCSETSYKCSACKDTGYIIKKWEGAGLAEECKCQEMVRLMKRFNSAMIPEEFKRSTLDDYKATTEVQEKMKNAAIAYLEEFGQIAYDNQGREKGHSLGYIAIVGDQKLNKLTGAQKAETKRKYNNYGLGKTHLLVAISKRLLKRGQKVLMVSDIALMDELMMNKRENMDAFNKRMHDLCTIPVLVWDELGKSAPTEAKKSTYFHIINERYKQRLPILFSSNEDHETLEDRIGGASISRILGMSYGRMYNVSGPDYRLTGGKSSERSA